MCVGQLKRHIQSRNIQNRSRKAKNVHIYVAEIFQATLAVYVEEAGELEEDIQRREEAPRIQSGLKSIQRKMEKETICVENFIGKIFFNTFRIS